MDLTSNGIQQCGLGDEFDLQRNTAAAELPQLTETTRYTMPTCSYPLPSQKCPSVRSSFTHVSHDHVLDVLLAHVRAHVVEDGRAAQVRRQNDDRVLETKGRGGSRTITMGG